MAIANNRRSNIILYTDKNSINSHRIRIIIAEKNVPADIIEVDTKKLPADLLAANPYGTLPTLVDRDLVLYEPSIIAEYLDERFPHPPLLPVYPIARAKTRLMILRVEREWLELSGIILAHLTNTNSNPELLKKTQKQLLESILSFMPIFSSMPYFLSDEFSLLDCCVAPLLFQLPALGIKLPELAKPIQQYLTKISARPSFKASLVHREHDYEQEFA